MFLDNVDFSLYTELARPCADRESRVFERAGGNRVCYRAYSLALAKEQHGDCHVILIEHGGGREVLRIKEIYGVENDWLLALEERRQYAALWALYATAQQARDTAKQQTASRYCVAFADGRLKKRRRNNRVYVEIAPPAEVAA